MSQAPSILWQDVLNRLAGDRKTRALANKILELKKKPTLLGNMLTTLLDNRELYNFLHASYDHAQFASVLLKLGYSPAVPNTSSVVGDQLAAIRDRANREGWSDLFAFCAIVEGFRHDNTRDAARAIALRLFEAPDDVAKDLLDATDKAELSETSLVKAYRDTRPTNWTDKKPLNARMSATAVAFNICTAEDANGDRDLLCRLPTAFTRWRRRPAASSLLKMVDFREGKAASSR